MFLPCSEATDPPQNLGLGAAGGGDGAAGAAGGGDGAAGAAGGGARMTVSAAERGAVGAAGAEGGEGTKSSANSA